MNRRSRRIPVDLDARGMKELPEQELHAVLRGADDLICQGGRSLLTGVLRGSASKDVLKHGLERSPVYGYFRNMSNEDTLARIDWTILHGYMRIEYNDRFPLLVYTQKGWEIEREIYADELLERIKATVRDGPPYEMAHLKDRDRGLIMLLLERIAATGDPRLIPALSAWKKIDYKKVQQRLGQVIRQIEEGNGL